MRHPTTDAYDIALRTFAKAKPTRNREEVEVKVGGERVRFPPPERLVAASPRHLEALIQRIHCVRARWEPMVTRSIPIALGGLSLVVASAAVATANASGAALVAFGCYLLVAIGILVALLCQAHQRDQVLPILDAYHSAYERLLARRQHRGPELRQFEI